MMSIRNYVFNTNIMENVGLPKWILEICDYQENYPEIYETEKKELKELEAIVQKYLPNAKLREYDEY